MQERVKQKIFNGDDVFNENEIVLTSLELEYEAERQIRFYELQRLFLAQKAESEKAALVSSETENKSDHDVELDNSIDDTVLSQKVEINEMLQDSKQISDEEQHYTQADKIPISEEVIESNLAEEDVIGQELSERIDTKPGINDYPCIDDNTPVDLEDDDGVINEIVAEGDFEPTMETIPEVGSEHELDNEPDNEPDIMPPIDSESELESTIEQASQIESEALIKNENQIEQETVSEVDSESEPIEKQLKDFEPDDTSKLDQQNPSLTQKLMNLMGFSGQILTQTADVQLNLTQNNPTDQIQTKILEVSEEITYREVTEDESNLLESILESQSHR